MVYINAADKALTIIGDPGKAISEIGRQKSSLGPEGVPSITMDHDTDKKGKAVPSFLLRVVIPYEENGSFYDVRVFFSLRNLAFDGTNAIINMVLLMDMVRWDESKLQSVVVYLSNGEADQNRTPISVQCCIISVCVFLKLDYAVFFHTIPGQMWLKE